MTLSYPDFAARQYQSGPNPGARVGPHGRFGGSVEPPPRWILDQLGPMAGF
jgi:hypothetical protein